MSNEQPKVEKPDVFQIAPETFIIPFIEEVPGMGFLYSNPAVIRGSQPAVVDTGRLIDRDRYLEALFGLVAPRDLKWIFLSHDDRDHAGNVMALLEQCPQARLVTDFLGVARLSDEYVLPPERLYLLNDGETLEIGDRAITAVRPPYFDSPATRGFFDPKTRTYFSADCFGAIIPNRAQTLNDVPADGYEGGFSFFNRANAWWHSVANPAAISRGIDRIRALDADNLQSYHGPATHGRAAYLCEQLEKLVHQPSVELPTQAEFEQMFQEGPK